MARRKMREISYIASGPYDPEFVGGLATKLDYKIDGTAAGAAAGFTYNSPHGLLDIPAIEQDNDVIIRGRAQDLHNLSALMQGSFSTRTPTAALVLGSATIDFQNPFSDTPIYFLDTSRKIIFRGAFSALLGYATTAPTGITAVLRTTIEEWEGARPAEFLTPRYVMHDFVFGANAASDLTTVISVPADMYVTGIYIRAHDESAAAQAQATDALVRNLRVEVQSILGSGRVYAARWEEAKELTARKFGIALADIPAGVVWADLGNPAGFEGLRYLLKGELISVIIDTSTALTIESGLTAMIPAASDAVRMIVVGWTPSQQAAAANRRQFGIGV